MDDNFKITYTVEWFYLDLKEKSQKPTHWLIMTTFFKVFLNFIYVYNIQEYIRKMFFTKISSFFKSKPN